MHGEANSLGDGPGRQTVQALARVGRMRLDPTIGATQDEEPPVASKIPRDHAGWLLDAADRL
jgi:hypothetical protein